jgi:uncharacterized protein YbaR (Trm112 family)
MELADDLLDVLLCPDAREPLYYFPSGDGDETEGFLFCEASRRTYRIEQGIPVMLVDDSELLSEADASGLARRAQEGGLRLTGPA